MPISKNSSGTLGDQLAEPTLTRLARLMKARSKVDENDPRYTTVLKRAFKSLGPLG